MPVILLAENSCGINSSLAVAWIFQGLLGLCNPCNIKKSLGSWFFELFLLVSLPDLAWAEARAVSSGPVSAQHVVVALIGIEFRPARAGLIEQAVTGCFVVEQGIAGGPGIATDAAVWG